MSSKIKQFLIGLSCILVAVSGQVSALTPTDRASLDNDSEYYWGAQQCTEEQAGTGDGTQASNLDYAGQPILTPAQLAAVQTNEPVYKQAAQTVGIPWQVLAAIHYRETGLGLTINANDNGLFQITSETWPTGTTSLGTFQQEADDAAQFIKQKMPALSMNSDPATIKETFFDYNGAAQAYIAQAESLGFPASQGYEGSPYVMNYADARRDPTVNTTTWGQIKTDNGAISYPADQAMGAFIVYSSLAGITSSGGCTATNCTTSGGASNGTANLSSVRQDVVCLAEQELAAWTPGTGQQYKADTDAYFKYSQNRNEEWCADFASWLYIQAGDPLTTSRGGNVSYVPDIQAIGTSSSSFTWHPLSSSYTPVPGDLAIHGEGHVNVVVAVSGNTITFIGGDQSGAGVVNLSSDQFEGNVVSEYKTSDPGADDPPLTGYVSPD